MTDTYHIKLLANVAFAGLLLLISPVMLTASQPGVLSRLQNEYEGGKLDREQYYLRLAQSVLSPESLPSQYVDDTAVPAKCGTHVMSEIQREWDTFSPELQMMLSALDTRPNTQFQYVSPDGFFRLHYDTVTGGASPPVSTEDADSSSVPDFIENMATYADSAWRQIVANYGYHTPPSDGTLGGDSLYDLYFDHFQFYGVTNGDNAGPEPWDDYSSHIVLHHTFLNFPPNQDADGNQKGSMKVAIAHELYHAVQFYYDAFMASWWMECTAVWMEDEVYPATNDNYNYFDEFWPVPQLSLLDESDFQHMYGSFVWPKYLTQNYGIDFPRIVLDSMAKPVSSLMSVLQIVLQSDGTTLYNSFSDFLHWNYMTGSRANGLYYEDASDYPEIAVLKRHTVLPSLDNWSLAAPYALGSNYIEVTNDSSHVGLLVFSMDTTYSAQWGMALITLDSAGVYLFRRATASEAASKKICVTIHNYQSLVFILYVKGSSYSGPFVYEYNLYFRPIGDADGSEAVDIDDVTWLLAYIFSGGPESIPVEASDADCSGYIDIDDVVYLIAYIFTGGPPPCGEGQP
ncbi:MAG: hypothetical protein KKG33_03840 [candidate division Zixibacteria bacterium]|nr:hypothetical protein [candidate division Zixibacteria bacterium]MBU1470806.1 hypothetical protein [candidate division Zixibacteria bacterium]MBU2624677.1 hypothetical protein [candidate division Zixibacteria bacterium]